MKKIRESPLPLKNQSQQRNSHEKIINKLPLKLKKLKKNKSLKFLARGKVLKLVFLLFLTAQLTVMHQIVPPCRVAPFSIFLQYCASPPPSVL